MSLLSIGDLSIEFGSPADPLVAVHAVSLSIKPSEVLGLVGESGSGKSLTSRAIMRLIKRPGRITAGEVLFDGRDVLQMSQRELRQFRANDVGMVFQDPFSSLNPVFRIGSQLVDALRMSHDYDRGTAQRTVVDMLDRVGIPRPEHIFRAYPHELSGGMRQRVMIAMATAARPRLLLADEPTTALDVLTQKQILLLLSEMRREYGMAMLLVSHDFGVIAQMCDRVAIMYGGQIVESGPVESIYDSPQHPYTRALLRSVPGLEPVDRANRRQPLDGQPPEIGPLKQACVFAERCAHARDDCRRTPLPLRRISEGHFTACPFEVTSDANYDEAQR